MAPASADTGVVALVGHDPVVLPLLASLMQCVPDLLFDHRDSFLLPEAKRGPGSQLIRPHLFLHTSQTSVSDLLLKSAETMLGDPPGPGYSVIRPAWR